MLQILSSPDSRRWSLQLVAYIVININYIQQMNVYACRSILATRKNVAQKMNSRAGRGLRNVELSDRDVVLFIC